MKLFFVFIGVAAVAVNSAPIDTLKIKFKISARDLPDKDNIGKGDPYVEIFYTEDNQKEEKQLGKTSVLSNTADPDWGENFELDFVRSKKQKLILRLYDEDIGEDDKLGVAYIDVADYVDKSGSLSTNLNKKGYVILESVIPFVTPAPPTTAPVVAPPAKLQVQNKSSSVVSHTTHGQKVFPTNAPLKLRFKLSANDLPNKDSIGASDPYVDMYFTDSATIKQSKFASTGVIDDNNSPHWNEVFEFQYEPNKMQKWFFEVRDEDYGDSDGLGKLSVDVVDYVAKGQKITLSLSKKGTLTIESVNAQANVQPTVKPAAILVTTTTVKYVPPTTKAPVPTPPPVIKLRFMLQARNLEDRDILGTSDPYVKVYSKTGSDNEVFMGNTKKFQDQEDVDFPDVFEFTYDPSKNQSFRFLVLDEDDNRVDEELGNVTVDVRDYVASKEDLQLNLKKGTLTILKAR